MDNNDMLNDTGKELADAFGMGEEELLGGIKSTKYNLAWMKVQNASLEAEGRGLDAFKRSLGRAYKGMVESLLDALEYNNIQKLKGELQHIDGYDAEKLLKAAQTLERIGEEGLVDVSVKEGGIPEVYVETMDEATELARQLRKAKANIELTDIHAELLN